MQALEKNEISDSLHYSSVVTLSGRDTNRIKSILIEAIESTNGVIADSPEEEIHCLSVDFFRVRS